MRQINGTHEGRQLVTEDTAFHGLVVGDLVVLSGQHLDLHGMVTGDLIVEEGASATVRGMVNGGVFNHGGQVDILGIVERISGDARTVVHKGAIVRT
jgi:hypothetical protein